MKEFIGKSNPSLKLKSQLDILKQQNVDVFLIGESGSGRDFCVEFLSGNNFFKIDAEFLEKTIQYIDLEIGHLYIDGLERLPIQAQIEILHLFEKRSFSNQKKVKGRIFYSTTPLIFQKIQNREFREDIFQKIYAVRIEIPSLRERRSDIPLFIHYFIDKYNLKYKKKVKFLSEKLEEFLFNYEWKGNLTQLESFLESQILFSKGTTLDKRNFKINFLDSSVGKNELNIQTGISLEEYEKAIIKANLVHFQGNRTKTAEVLGISLRHLYRKIKKFNLNL